MEKEDRVRLVEQGKTRLYWLLAAEYDDIDYENEPRFTTITRLLVHFASLAKTKQFCYIHTDDKLIVMRDMLTLKDNSMFNKGDVYATEEALTIGVTDNPILHTPL